MVSAVHGTRAGLPVLTTYMWADQRFSVNHIKQPDGPLLHCHPWTFCWSLILNGGYTHEYAYLQPDGTMGPVGVRSFKPGDVNFMTDKLYHRIASVEPDTYTQIFWGPNIDGVPQLPGYWVDGVTRFQP
jgi:hypothetical protein